MKTKEPRIVAELAYIYAGGKIYPMARLMKNEKLELSPELAFGSCISLYSAFLSMIPESSQLQFEDAFKTIFNDRFDSIHNYIETIKDE